MTLAAAPTPLDAVLARRPVVAARLQALVAGLWTHPAVPPDVVELCRLRIATLLGAAGESCIRHAAARDAGLDERRIAALPAWPGDPGFSSAERAALALAEQATLDPHGVEPVQRAAVAAAFGDAGLVVLLQAVTVHEGLARLRLLLAPNPPAGVVIPAPAAPPPFDGALPPVFRTSALAAAPALLAAFLRLYGTLWHEGRVDPTVLEVVRIRNARRTGCATCRSVRFAPARDAGLDEDGIALVDDGWAASALPARHKAALAVADAFLGAPATLAGAARERLLAPFAPDEIVDLGVALVCFLAFAKVAVALGHAREDLPVTVVPAPSL